MHALISGNVVDVDNKLMIEKDLLVALTKCLEANKISCTILQGNAYE